MQILSSKGYAGLCLNSMEPRALLRDMNVYDIQCIIFIDNLIHYLSIHMKIRRNALPNFSAFDEEFIDVWTRKIQDVPLTSYIPYNNAYFVTL